MAYKLLALDMDGTTLNSDKVITPKTQAAIDRLLVRGVHVVVASGRCLAEISDYREPFKNMRYGILMSGGMVFDFKANSPIALHPVTYENSLELIDAGLDEHAMIHLLTIHESIAQSNDITHMSDFQMGIYQTMFERICTRVDDMKQYAIDHRGEIVKVNLYHRTPESRRRNVDRLCHLDMEMVFAETTSLEASPKGVSKGKGLVTLCDHLGIDLSETIAIGDAPNDLEILETAGVAVVMGNGLSEIKAIADYVTDDNDHDGVAAAIDHFFGED